MRWAASLLLAATGVILSAGSVTAAPAGVPCSAAKLVVWLDTQGDHAAGSAYYQLRFTNLGSACTLRGFPGVSAVDLNGRQLGKPASRDRSVGSRSITVARGATAKAVLRITNVHNFPRSACRPVSAAGLRVYPPNQTGSKLVPFPFGACAGGAVFLFVRAVEKT